MDSTLSRYSRQMLYENIGRKGQEQLAKGRAVIMGCGALGTVAAGTLARAGVGHLRLVDRDFIEENNLQRQILFDEEDIRAGLPKAEAARLRLSKVNSTIEIESEVADINHRNIEDLIKGANVVVDATDNFEARYLINEACVKNNIPWIYGACEGSSGMTMTILPKETPCLRCVYDAPPPPDMSRSCDTAGILGSIVNIVASLQATEAMKILTGRTDALQRDLLSIDVWTGELRHLSVGTTPRTSCAVCQQADYELLEGRAGSQTTSLCGRDAIQITHLTPVTVNFAELEKKLSKLGHVHHSRFMLKFESDGNTLTVFPDGRTIVQGTTNPTVARNLYAKYIGV